MSRSGRLPRAKMARCNVTACSDWKHEGTCTRTRFVYLFRSTTGLLLVGLSMSVWQGIPTQGDVAHLEAFQYIFRKH